MSLAAPTCCTSATPALQKIEDDPHIRSNYFFRPQIEKIMKLLIKICVQLSFNCLCWKRLITFLRALFWYCNDSSSMTVDALCTHVCTFIVRTLIIRRNPSYLFVRIIDISRVKLIFVSLSKRFFSSLNDSSKIRILNIWRRQFWPKW